MELLDRYLQAVKKHLPQKRQDDILAELRANMESQLEDKEAELGRPLTQGEAEDWLRAMGPPILVASHYRPQQYLIGPTLYPMYLYVLRLAVFWAIVVYTVANTVLFAVATPHSASVADMLMRVPGVMITVAAWVTLVFAAFEFIATRYPEQCPPVPGLVGSWSPSSLPPLEKSGSANRKPRNYALAVAEVVFGFLLLVWLLLIPSHPFLVLGPGVVFLNEGPFKLADAWWTFYWWIVALNALQLAWKSIDLIQGRWEYPAAIQPIVFKAWGLIPLGLMLAMRGRDYVLLKDPVNQAHYGAALDSINKAIPAALLAIVIIAGLQLAWDIGQLVLRAYRGEGATR
jgi:hypothetical protein